MIATRTAIVGLLLCGCALPYRPQIERGATHVGVPRPEIDIAVLDKTKGLEESGAETGTIRLPDRLVLPAAYRLTLVDGRLTLDRETDFRSLDPGAASMRIVSGAVTGDDPAYQPGLLPQELAAEVAADRQSAARMDHALEAVMRRSHELAEQAVELEAQSKRMAELLIAAQERARGPEPALRPHAAKSVPGNAGANPH
jgi:hypothetical protein